MTTPEDPFVYKTRSEQRLEWLMSRKRPLSEAEQDELYRALHAIYQRDWRAHRGDRIEQECNLFARSKAKGENARTLRKVLREAVREPAE